MTGAAPASEQNLTGVWHGLYTYANGLSISFMATLIDSGSVLSGSTTEPCTTGQCPSDTIHANLAGRRQASAVTFTKIYEQAGPGYERPWHIVGGISGSPVRVLFRLAQLDSDLPPVCSR